MNSPTLHIGRFLFRFRYVSLCDLDIPREKWLNYLQAVETCSDAACCGVAVSDLGLHCLPITLLGVSRLQLVNAKNCTYDFMFNAINSRTLFWSGAIVFCQASLSEYLGLKRYLLLQRLKLWNGKQRRP